MHGGSHSVGLWHVPLSVHAKVSTNAAAGHTPTDASHTGVSTQDWDPSLHSEQQDPEAQSYGVDPAGRDMSPSAMQSHLSIVLPPVVLEQHVTFSPRMQGHDPSGRHSVPCPRNSPSRYAHSSDEHSVHCGVFVGLQQAPNSDTPAASWALRETPASSSSANLLIFFL